MPDRTVAADGIAQTFSFGESPSAGWWKLFGSPELDALVRQAIANNPTLEAAQANLLQSRHKLRAGYGVFFPQVGAELDATRQRLVPANEGLATPPKVFDLITLGGTVSYALDVFGGERRMVEGLRAQVDYQRYLTQAAYLSLCTNVVNAGIARAGYQSEAVVTQEMIALQEQQLRTTEAAIRAGTTAYAAVLAVRGALATSRASLASLQQKISQSEDLLASLEGVVPAGAMLPTLRLAALSLPAGVPVTIPSELARQRPDILMSEALLHAANANIGVATAALFPSVSLGATYGGAAATLGALPDPAGRFWSIGPSVSIPVFQGGSLWYQRKAAIDAHRAAEAVYRQTVLDAFAQVADALHAIEHDAEVLDAEVEAQRAARETLALARVSYQAGLLAYLDVWTADVALHEVTVEYLQAVAIRHQDTVALFAALGGGWWTEGKPEAPDAAP
jgi:NodT family efflux transporter outer membrane factor (OMF) lipoprotein